MVESGSGFSSPVPERCDGIFVDIDHTPHHHLHPSHADFYTADGLRRLAGLLNPTGVFALWSDDRPDAGFITTLDEVFTSTAAHLVSFPSMRPEEESYDTVYIARVG
jgi:hypothetical protein